MSKDGVRAVLVIVGSVLLIWSMSLQNRDRDRRERASRQRPQPLQHTPTSRLLPGLFGVCVVGAVITIFL
jgi:hypothetical protein